jgi:hypothetical protein
MKRTMLALTAVLLVVIPTIGGCGKTTITTQTEIQTVPGPVTTQTVNITGPTTTTTQTATVPGPAITTTQTTTATITATVTGPPITVTQTKTAIPTQGFNYVSSITPASPTTLHFNAWVSVTVEYVITDPGGARMWAIPTTNGQQTPNCAYGMQSAPAGRGTTNVLGFSIASGSVKINEIRLLMMASTGAVTLFEAYIPVDYSYVP